MDKGISFSPSAEAGTSSTGDLSVFCANHVGYQPWRTRFDELNENIPQARKLPLATRLRANFESLSEIEPSGIELAAELEQIAEEYLWLLGDRPYYNIHPRIVPYLCRCRLDKIPASYLEIPGGFDTVDIRFSQMHPDLTVDGNEYVRNVLIAKKVLYRLGEGFTSFFVEGRRPISLSQATDQLMLHIDLGERFYEENAACIKHWTIPLDLDGGISLEDEFERFEHTCPEGIAPGTRRREVVKNCLRIVATIGFMANTPEDNFLEYDVLSKDRRKFSEADEEIKGRLIDRARRRGKHGWNVGTNEMFLGDIPEWSSGGSDGRGREHTHAHIRSGHLHAVRCGEGRRNVKIKWFRPTVVRPDLRFS